MKRAGHVALIVLVETAWVLQRRYRASREEIDRVIETLLRIQRLRIADADIVWSALRLFRSSGADFADCLIARANLAAGCEHTATFDAKAGRIAGMKLLA